jgi:hypothetical protein
MATEFRLEIFFEQDQDQEFAQGAAEKLRTLVGKLAPHIELRIKVQKATRKYYDPPREGRNCALPFHRPIEEGSQTLLITREQIGAEGWGKPGEGCLSKQGMEQKEQKRGNHADITIHEWLHTIAGKTIDGREIPHPHNNERCGFYEATAPKGSDGCPQWYDWYRYMLRDYP